MLISITDFKGEMPLRTPRLLPDVAGTFAVNTRLDSGAIRPFNATTFVTDLVSAQKAVYLDGATWLSWNAEVNVVPGPTDNDERLYVTGDGAPQMYADDTWFALALPPPDTAPAISLLGTLDPDAAETVTYAYTFVTSYGEESAPSPLATSIEWSPGLAVRVTSFDTPTADRAITSIRLYRSATSESGITGLYFVSEFSTATATYDHDIDADPINELISTTDHDTPPTGLKGLIAMPNGMMVAHTKRQLLFSEPYQPHAWPIKYRLTTDYDIVGLAAFGSYLAVMTKGTPYRGQGTHPDTFTLEKIEENLPCLAKRGIVDLGYAAAYPSADGLVVVTSSSAQIVTRHLFNRLSWTQLDPSSFVASHLNGRYLFGFSGTIAGAGGKTGIIDLTGADPYFSRSDVKVKCAFNDIRTGLLYVQDVDNNLVIFDDPDSTDFLAQTWKSKLYDLAFPVGFGWCRVEGTALIDPLDDFTIRIFADGVELHTSTSLNTPFRLPGGLAEHWQISIEGSAEVTSIALATSIEELARRV